MTPRRGHRALLGVALCVGVALPGALEAQAVEGRLVWPSGEPVVGAVTTLLDGGFQRVASGRSDAMGRYRLVAPAPGDYVLVVDVEGYASQMSDVVQVAAAGTVTLDLAVESRAVDERNLLAADTLEDAALLAAGIADACRGQFIPALHSIIFGAVLDAETGSVIPGAAVSVRWKNRDAISLEMARNVEAHSDDAGIYLICRAPGGEDLTIRASSHDTDGVEVAHQLQLGTISRVDLEIPLYDADLPGQIWGLVRDQARGHVLSGVEVRVNETDVRAVTDARGIFRMPDVPWGLRTLSFSYPSYGRQEQAIRVIGGRSLRVEVHLPPAPIEMPPLVVTVRPRRWFGDMESLQERIDRGAGVILTSERIDAQQPRHLADVLRALPGVDVRQSGSTLSGTFTVQFRGAQNMMGQSCAPAVWVDGQKWRNPTEAYTSILGSELEVVEVYRGPAEVPGEFLDSSASCGALIVWTRRGRTFRR